MQKMGIPDRLLIAVGGNAIHPAGIRGTSEEQFQYAAAAGRSLLPIMLLENELIITHGNGPGVGKVIMRQTIARDRVAPMSLDICVANSQGGIAYVLMQAFENALREAGNQRHVVCLLTQVEVDPEDPAFNHATKPIGYFFSNDEAKALAKELGWQMREDSGRGWRLVVPSPKPKHICDISLVEAVAKRGTIIIAGGGGGIPVVRDRRGVRRGIEAVIDKDLTSAHMANVLGIKDMMILTGVPHIMLHFGTPRQKEITSATVAEMRRYVAEGHFPEGSMGPKVEAAIRFIEGGGNRVIISQLETAFAALKGETGTHICRDDS
ncbi:MAG: carbamate kinase [Desulfobacterales bacterium]|nr:carbamate kinase [Desulfobacterales bacterium]